MQASTYTVITSPLNDSKQPIALKVSSPADYHLKVYFTDKSGQNPVAVGEKDGKKGEQIFTFEGQWLMKAPAEGKLFAEITYNGQTETYQAQLELKASTLKKPLGDPNTKFVMTPGFQITLPSGWVKPFGGMTISLNLPLAEKYQLRGYFDINGSGAFTMGTTVLGDLTKKMTENWKTEDQKALDKAANEAKGKGYMAENKAKNGGDWAGRSKFKPLQLGAISFDISFFAFVQVQYSEDGYDYGQIFGKGGAGFTGTIKGSYTLQWPLVSLGAFVSATLTIFPEIAVMVDTYWPSGAAFPEFKKFEYAKAAINIIFRIEIGVEACLGLKGVLSVSIRGVGFLEFVFRAGATVDLDELIQQYKDTGSFKIPDAETKKSFEIYAGGSVDVILEVLWAKSTYAILNPPVKFMLYPDKKQVSDSAPLNPVQRFIASLLASAQAEDANAPQQGGGQVDTSNNDLAVSGTLLTTGTNYMGKSTIVSMRPSDGGSAKDILLYIDSNFGPRGGAVYPKPILVSVPVEGVDTKGQSDQDVYYQALVCQNGQTGSNQDHFTPQDGYEVIDFDCWVEDVSSENITTYNWAYRNPLKLTDVLFTVCILAKDFHEETEILEDGSKHTEKVPDKTWAYVSCYFYDGFRLYHVILPQEKDTNNYLAMCYPLEGDGTQDPSEKPRIMGTLTNDEALHYHYTVVTNPQGVGDLTQRKGYFLGNAVNAMDNYATRVNKAKNAVRPIGYIDSYMNGRLYQNFQYYKQNNSNYQMIYLAKDDPWDEVYDLVLSFLTVDVFRGSGTFLGARGSTIISNVTSMAARNPKATNSHVFFLLQTEDGTGCRLMGCQTHYDGIHITSGKDWSIRDYDLDMPRADLHWTTLYGRECLYWMETAGQTEDGKNNLFKIRGMWYDESADAFSEPFVLATIKTDVKQGSPDDIQIVSEKQSYYFVHTNDNQGKELYGFTFQLVPGLRLIGNVLTDSLANPGSYDDMLLTVFNNGNLPLTGVDLIAYHEENGKKAEAFETIHLDILNPANKPSP